MDSREQEEQQVLGDWHRRLEQRASLVVQVIQDSQDLQDSRGLQDLQDRLGLLEYGVERVTQGLLDSPHKQVRLDPPELRVQLVGSDPPVK